MIQVYYGYGKGKTTAAIGSSIRAAGHGFSVLFMQFLKNGDSGELSILRAIQGITVRNYSTDYGFVYQMTANQKREVSDEYDKMLDQAIESDAFLIVLDEVVHAINAEMISRKKIEKILEKKSEIIMTGQEIPAWLLNRADYVSCINKIKHPFDDGMRARVGIEF